MVAASVLAAWGDDVELGERIELGARNQLVRLVMDGRRAVARQGGRSGASLDWELDLLAHLHEAGVPVPRVLSTRDGRRSVDNVVVMEEVPGEPVDLSRAGEIVDLVRQVHRSTPGWPQRPGFASSRDLQTQADGGDVHLDSMPAEVVELCRQAWAGLPEMADLVVHGDPNPGNVLDSGNQLVLIDWDEARVDHPWLDLAALGPQNAGLPKAEAGIAYRAAVAWETATCWTTEPDYAHGRLQELRELSK